MSSGGRASAISIGRRAGARHKHVAFRCLDMHDFRALLAARVARRLRRRYPKVDAGIQKPIKGQVLVSRTRKKWRPSADRDGVVQLQLHEAS